MIKVVTHDGDFHADDVFAIATLQIYLGEDTEINVIRTRDQEEIHSADWVFDVGGVYESTSNRYDHHQNGAPIRENGIPYAAFGLAWKHLGEDVAGSPEVAHEIETKLAQAIDAGDNGISIYTLQNSTIQPYELYQVIESYHELQDAHNTVDDMFMEAVHFARGLLLRELRKAHRKITLQEEAREIYKTNPPTNGVIIAEHPISISAFSEFSDVLVVVKPKTNDEDSRWIAKVMPKDEKSFENRALFPETWAGLRDEDLANVCGIEDAVFCHKARFIFVAKTKSGAIKASKQIIPTTSPEST